MFEIHNKTYHDRYWAIKCGDSVINAGKFPYGIQTTYLTSTFIIQKFKIDENDILEVEFWNY